MEDEWAGAGRGVTVAAGPARRAAGARCEGTGVFTGLMLADNVPMQALLSHLGTPALAAMGDGTVEATVELQPSKRESSSV